MSGLLMDVNSGTNRRRRVPAPQCLGWNSIDRPDQFRDEDTLVAAIGEHPHPRTGAEHFDFGDAIDVDVLDCKRLDQRNVSVVHSSLPLFLPHAGKDIGRYIRDRAPFESQSCPPANLPQHNKFCLRITSARARA